MGFLSNRSKASGLVNTLVFLGVLALTICLVRVAVFRSNKRFVGQGYMYKELAVALASGHGYSETQGPLRGHPTMRRAPLWPAVLSIPIRVCPQCNPIAVTQFADGFMQAATAFGVALLVGLLTGSRRRMLVACLATALLPEAQPLMWGGFCEPLAAAVLVFGTFLLCSGPRFFFGGVVLLSLLPLVRPNFVPLWVSAAAFAWWLQSSKRFGFLFDVTRRRLIVATLLFYLPTTLWILRNYAVSGAFPVFTGTSSMTFYGNYNSVSATMGPNFARWRDPAAVPLRNPNQVTSEVQEFRYYDSQGKQFILRHWKIVPLLVGAHVVLSMLPDPVDGAHRYSFWLVRLLIYVAAIIAVRRNPVGLESWFGVMLVCSVLMTVITVALYSGENRYLYPQNILLMVLVFSARYTKAPVTDEPRAPLAKAHAASGAAYEAP